MSSEGSLNENITPVRQQYLDIKRQHPGAILFFRLGDFYETFDEDAELVARELDIVLTSRNVAKGARVPMAGVPHHAAESYLARLIERGHHVAICEQVGTEPIKGLMPREVVRIVTPGTVVEPGLLPGDGNNYLAAALVHEGRAGLAYADLTTGEFAATELDAATLRAEVGRLAPAETLHIENGLDLAGLSGHGSPWPGYRFEPARAKDTLLAHFKAKSLKSYGLEERPLAARAAGALLQYVQETQPASLSLLSSLRAYTLDEFMNLDASARRNLELTETLRGELAGSLLGTLDRAITPMGRRLLRQWVGKPLLELAAIHARQEGVAWLHGDGMRRAELRTALKPLGDLERLVNRMLGGTAQPRDLAAMRSTLEALPAVLKLVGSKSPAASLLQGLSECAAELKLLQSALADEPPAVLGHVGVIRAGYAAELDELMAATSHARDWIANLEAAERERTGIKSLKVGYNKVHGYYIEVTKAKDDGNLPAEYIRKQTLVNAERYITPEMKDVETQVLNAEERILAVEARLFRELCGQLAASAGPLLAGARALATLDVLAALAEVAALQGYVRPTVEDSPALEIVDGRHPVVERLLPAQERFVPNDTVFEEGECVRLITGPNMSGKSTYLRQVALIVLLAQMGSFVPAESARIGLVDRIFTRIGAQDEIHAGHSTFMVEMVETASILNHATARSLLILDEIGRGTSTYDGLSIAWAVIEHIHNEPRLKARTLFATHYHELTALAASLPGVRNYNVAVSEGDGTVVFLHKIIPGGADRSYGIHVGQLAGLPRPVLERAQQILAELESNGQQPAAGLKASEQQAPLFALEHPLVDELKKLEVDGMSPIEALNKLAEWKGRLDTRNT